MGDLKNLFLDPQTCYGQTLLGSDQSGKGYEENFKNNRYNEFVITPVHFNLNFPKNHDFDD